MHQRGALQQRSTTVTGQCASVVVLPPAPALPHGPRRADHRTRQVLCAAAPQEGRAAGIVGRLASSTLGALTAVSLLSSAPAEAEVIKLPASSNPEVFAAQRVMVEAWEIVKEACVFLNDPSQWPNELRKHMVAAYNQSDGGQPEKAWEEINAMLAYLGDPYTRRIDAEEYQTFQVTTDGELKKGIGLMLAKEPSASGHLQVLAPIRGGPADRAGILPGDEVVSINGQDTTGWSGDHAASVLRGQGGSEVRLRLVRRTEGIPGVPSRPEPREPPPPPVVTRDVSLQREAVAISPLFAHVLTAPSTGGDTIAPTAPSAAKAATAATTARQVGYLRLSQFSGNAASEMRRAVTDLKAQGAKGFILDLRSNPGGLVRAGVDVAALWLDGNQTVFTVASRDPETQARTTEVQTTETLQPALTHDPLVVLVDGMSASASEIVSGALHDHGRALVMGDTASYGKGRIQSVFELQDGSALFVTVATYLTPSGNDIDLKGIRPDLGCRPGALGVRAAPALRDGNDARARAPALQRNALGLPLPPQRTQQHGNLTVPPDPIVAQAATARGAPQQQWVAAAVRAQQHQQQPELEPTGFVPGVPVDASTESLLLEALSKDRCVLAAEEYLDTALGASSADGATEAGRARRVLTPAQQLYLAYINMNRP